MSLLTNLRPNNSSSQLSAPQKELLPKTSALDPNRPLSVVKVDPQDYPKIIELVETWRAAAWQKSKMCASDPNVRERFRDNEAIAGYVKVWCRQKSKCKKDDLYACIDNAGKIHGLVVVCDQKPILDVHYLMTNPVNIRCKANDIEPDRVEGAARAFCSEAAKEAPKLGFRTIRLTPLHTSVPFYKKFGFRWDVELQEEAGMWQMLRDLPQSPITSNL